MLIGIVAGCIVGAIWPATKDASGEIVVKGATVLEPLGTVFLNLMFCIAVPTVFCSISSAIATMQSAKRVGQDHGRDHRDLPDHRGHRRRHHVCDRPAHPAGHGRICDD